MIRKIFHFVSACGPYDQSVPHYDVRCDSHGLTEVFSYPSRARDLRCGACGGPAAWVPSKVTAGVRIDAAAESVSTPSRVKDGTAGIHLGLPGVTTVVGTRPDGKAATAYRPITHHEVGSNRNLRELAKRNNCTPIEGGRYRSIA